ncbi:hypothetical protein CK203_010559 [Vitis vinifera]|uniref:Secreted protein n=1 Tax=Vitis vinifera TaxID=29760 RepID=A0A438JT43_VITVI|nr:hypothetical protein CK203_010559 [Vitis vinifera]
MGALQAMVVCLFLVRACTTNAQVEQWKSATATYSKETDASIITEGACGYGDLHKTSYGKYSAGLREPICYPHSHRLLSTKFWASN